MGFFLTHAGGFRRVSTGFQPRVLSTVSLAMLCEVWFPCRASWTHGKRRVLPKPEQAAQQDSLRPIAAWIERTSRPRISVGFGLRHNLLVCRTITARSYASDGSDAEHGLCPLYQFDQANHYSHVNHNHQEPDKPL